jgi:hypothetical protein
MPRCMARAALMADGSVRGWATVVMRGGPWRVAPPRRPVRGSHYR